MKILKFFLFTAALFTMAACSSDDDGGTPALELNNTNLAGTYEVTFFQGTEVRTEDVQGTEVEFFNEEYVADSFDDVLFVFNENGTVNVSGGYRLTTTTTTIDNPDSVEEVNIVSVDEATIAYNTNSSANTLVIDGEIYTVTLFSNTELRLQYDGVELDGDETYTFFEEWRLIKQN